MSESKDVWIDLWGPLEKRGGRLQWVIYRLRSYKSGGWFGRH